MRSSNKYKMQIDELVNKEVFKRGFHQTKTVLNGQVVLSAAPGALPYIPGSKAKQSDQFRIEAVANGSQIGWVNFLLGEGNDLEALDIFIDPKWRRKGIATELYQFAKELGNTVVPSDKQTAAGKALWASGKITESAEPLNEMASAVLYHYSPLSNAVKILKSKRFDLSVSIGTGVEREKQSGDRWYYLSTARNKSGDYTKREGYFSGVVFNLNGVWLNNNHRSKAVDYWDRMWLSSHDTKVTSDKRFREEEDRVYSRNPSIEWPSSPTELVTAIHVYYRFDPADKYSAPRGHYVRTVMLEAKKLGIPVYMYKEKQAWILQDTRRSVSLSDVKDQMKGSLPTPKTWHSDVRDDYKPYKELFYATREDQLSPDAAKRLYNLRYYGDSSRTTLENDIHNDRKAAPEKVIKFLQVMRLAKASSVEEFLELLKNKWKANR